MKETKQCYICGETIDAKDSFYVISSYVKGTYLGKTYAHKTCMNRKNAHEQDLEWLKKETKTLIAKSNKLIEQTQ